MNSVNGSIDCLRHRVLFAEALQGQLLEVIQGFLNSPDGRFIELEAATDGVLDSFSLAGFELRTRMPIPVDMGTLDTEHLVPNEFRLTGSVSPEGVYNLNFTRHWGADEEK